MTGLIYEIQRDALDNDVPIDSLLRRMKLAVAKLRLENLEAWVESELNGYVDNPPNYRSVFGQPCAWNPYNGWIPIYAPSEELMELFSTANIRQNVCSLEDLIRNSSHGTLDLPMPHGATKIINEMANYESARMVHKISRGTIVSILSIVRNMVLEWAIEMEKTGVVGKGLSFSTEEKEQARDKMATINIDTFTGILGSHNTSGNINSGNISIEKVNEEIQKIKQALPSLENTGVDTNALSSAVTKIEKETAKRKPNQGKIRKLLEDANQAVVGASGSLLADGVKAAILSLMSM